MEIRYINQNDNMPDISNVYENSWKYAYKNIIPQSYLDSIQKGRWANVLNRQGTNNIVLTENDRIIGTVGFGGSRWEGYGDYGEILSIYLLPEYMGKGYGKLLLNRCIVELNKMGYDKIVLRVLEENVRARRFYEKNGFVCTDDFISDNIGGKDLRELLYILI